MDRVLKLGFAMGGGVSLGTFSGSSLTEVIKLYVIELARRHQEGIPRKDWDYQKIEVDVFSGASAGCLSLVLMLRALAFQTLNEHAEALARLRQDARNSQLMLWLEDKSGEDPIANDLLKQLVAIEVAQMLQEKAWVEQISFENLVPKGSKSGDFINAGGLLNHEAVADIARNLILEPVEAVTDFGTRSLLPKRVLLAASIANLSPIINDGRREFNIRDFGFVGLTDGLRSSVHRDMRVFDLNFEAPKLTKKVLRRDNSLHPFRWIFMTDGTIPADISPGDAFSLGDRQSWEMLATTAMASGAVPLAFPPVVLTRWDYEYGFDRDRAGHGQEGCTWPQSLWGNADSHNFTFVDGGTFNNEPIREAFRLASFLDSKDEREFIRKIYFVDPFVSEEKPSLANGINYAFASRDKDNSNGKERPYRRAAFDKLIPHVGHMIGALMDEGRVVEGDKIFQTRRRFEIRRQIREIIFSLNIQKEDVLVKCANKIIAQSKEILNADFFRALIPITSPELSKELDATARQFEDRLPGIDLKAGKNFVADPDALEGVHFSLWFKALLVVYVDIMMDLGGKSDQAELIAIAPVKAFHRDGSTIHAEYMELAGAPFGGFAGFMSIAAKASDFLAGRYAAGLYLEMETQFSNAHPRLVHAKDHMVGYSEYQPVLIPGDVISEGMKRLSKRVSEAIKQAHLISIFPGLDQILESVLAAIVSGIIKRITADAATKRPFELRVQIADKALQKMGLELDGRGGGDYQAVAEPGEDGLWLSTVIDCYHNITNDSYQAVGWRGFYLTDDDLLPVYRNSLGSINDRKVCDLCLPEIDLVVKGLKSGAVGFSCTLLPSHLEGKIPQRIEWTLRFPSPKRL